MFKSIILIGIVSLLSTVPLKTKRIIKKPGYTVVYDETKKQPVEVTYRVMCHTSVYSRSGMEFVEEEGVVTSTDEDYLHNEWDKGHMAPAADYACSSTMLRETFSYVNCALQHEKLNRGVWKKLESFERELCRREVVNVIISVHFSSSSRRLNSGAIIPDAFTKKIKHGKRTDIFYFKNEAPQYTDIEKYRLDK